MRVWSSSKMIAEPPALLVEPIALAVLVGQERVEHRVRRVGIVLGVLLGELLVVERIALADRGLRRRALPHEHRIDQRLPVDGERERLAEVLGVEQRVLDRVEMVEVELEDHDVRRGLLQRIEAVVARLLAIEQHRLVGRRRDVLVHHVDLALQRLQQQDLGIGDHLVDDAVEIGELRAFGVDLEIVGVADRDRLLGVLSGRDLEHPGVERRPVRVLEERVVVQEADLALEQRDPALQALLLGELVGVRVVADVELLEVVLGRARRSGPAAPRRAAARRSRSARGR